MTPAKGVLELDSDKVMVTYIQHQSMHFRLEVDRQDICLLAAFPNFLRDNFSHEPPERQHRQLHQGFDCTQGNWRGQHHFTSYYDKTHSAKSLS